MPDWLTHTMIGWITGKTTKQDIALVVIGSLIPDLVKINLAFTWLRWNSYQVFNPLHTPIGAFLVVGIITVFFKDARKAFVPLGIGVLTHFILDFFLVHVHGGMRLFFPFSWGEWQYYLIRYDDYMVTVVSILVAFSIYGTYWVAALRKKQKTRS